MVQWGQTPLAPLGARGSVPAALWKGKRMKLLNRELKYSAHRVKVYEDTIEKPTGEKVYYDFVENRNGSGVLLVDNTGKLLFVKQYRNSINDMDVEIPAGCAELNDNVSLLNNPENVLDELSEKAYSRSDFESPENPFYRCAIREAEEETGLIPTKLEFVSYILAAAGLFSERTAVYIGTDLIEGKMSRDPDEYIDIIRLTPEEAMDYIAKGLITDSKTIIAIQHFVINAKNI
ncbi:ADP-ribose pyrophosphatase [Lachnospiraceae bacterium NE2001]|nr:ADP-ribose pyrophosphatase [Lachnospiraceae bacterium NE2001]